MQKTENKDCAVHAVKLETLKEDISEIKSEVKELHDMLCRNGFYSKFSQTNLRTNINTWLIGLLMSGFLGLAFWIIKTKL